MEAILPRFRAQLAESEPSDRSFGLLAAAILLILGLRHGWLFIPAAALATVAALCPTVLRAPKRAWLYLGFLMSLIASPLVLGVLFFGVMTPVGLLMRAIGRDPLGLKPDGRSPTYWFKRTNPASDMSEQF